MQTSSEKFNCALCWQEKAKLREVISAFVKQGQHFAANERQTEVILQQNIYFHNFPENEYTMVLF